MARLEIVIALVVLAFTIYAFIDCLMTENDRVRALPKVLWALIIVVISPFGGIIWFVLGKERRQRSLDLRSQGTRAPDDDPAFLRSLGEDKARDARIRELEARLAELDDPDNDPKK